MVPYLSAVDHTKCEMDASGTVPDSGKQGSEEKTCYSLIDTEAIT